MFCGISHAVDYHIGALVNQLTEVLGVVAVGMDEPNPRIPQILRKAGLCLSARSNPPACGDQLERSDAAHQPVPAQHDCSRHPGSLGHVWKRPLIPVFDTHA